VQPVNAQARRSQRLVEDLECPVGALEVSPEHFGQTVDGHQDSHVGEERPDLRDVLAAEGATTGLASCRAGVAGVQQLVKVEAEDVGELR
jgi:hypothetical protein